MSSQRILTVDSRKRVTLGSLARHDLYWATLHAGGSILLEPVTGTYEPDSSRGCDTESEDGFICTRTEGHAGDHEAHTSPVWPPVHTWSQP